MMKKIFMIILVSVFTILITKLSFAAPAFIQDSNYNLSTIKTILIFEPTFEQKNLSDFDKQNLYQVLLNYAKEKNINFISYQEYIDSLSKKLGIDIKDLQEKDPQKAQELIIQNAKDYADAGLYTTVSRYFVSSRYVPEQHYTEKRMEKARRRNSKGYWEEYEYPVYIPRYIAAYNQPVLQATAQFALVDLKTQKPIAQLTDPRERDGSASDTPLDMYKRIVNNFFNKLKSSLKR